MSVGLSNATPQSLPHGRAGCHLREAPSLSTPASIDFDQRTCGSRPDLPRLRYTIRLHLSSSSLEELSIETILATYGSVKRRESVVEVESLISVVCLGRLLYLRV